MDIFRNRSIPLQVLLIALVLAMMAMPVGAFPSQDADYSGEGLEIDLHNILINEANGILEVQEIIRVVNGGDQPIVVDKTLPEEEQYTFQVVLPPSTNSLSFPENIELDNDIISTATGFAYTIPLEPGINELEFFYKIEPNNEGQFLLDRKIVYPTQSVYFIIQGEVGLSGAKMVYYGNMDIGQVYYWDDPIPGEEVAVIAGKGIKPDNSGSGSGSGSGSTNLERGYRASFHSAGHIRFWDTSPFARIEPHVFLVVFFGVLSSGIYFYIKGRRKEDEGMQSQDDEDKFQELLESQKELLGKLAQTEKRYQAEELNQEEYQKLSNMYKEKLVKIKLQLKLLSD